ncbi:MAG: hypothetical protein DRO88_13580 [Promethearchaeia archaeon]|nr:MAG: hypothetical protein DRO88_13580 [Candidatus Lokiarchaeia archaeon]
MFFCVFTDIFSFFFWVWADLSSIQFNDLESLLEIYWSIFSNTLQKTLYFFIDEPQNLIYWERFLRALHDDYAFPIFITGSSSKLLSKEISTHLRGRTITTFISILSFREFLIFKNISPNVTHLLTKEKSKILSLIKEYLEFGGFPEIVLNSDFLVKTRILHDLIDLTIYRDLIDRYRIRNTKMIKNLIHFLIQNSCKYISINKIYNTFRSQGVQIDKNTLYEYFSMLEDVTFIHSLPRFSTKVHQISTNISSLSGIEKTCF